MRRPSGDNSTLPTERSLERSLLSNPWAPLDGVSTPRPTVQSRNKPPRTKIDCSCMKISRLNFVATRMPRKASAVVPRRAHSPSLQVLIHPFNPAPIHIHGPHRIPGEMACDRVGDELDRNA